MKTSKEIVKFNRNKWGAIVGICIFSAWCVSGHSDSYIRDRVVKLRSEHGECSGEQVQAPSGQSYILTAGHCRELADEGGTFTVHTESGAIIKRKIIAEDPSSDLLLVEGLPGVKGLSIAGWAGQQEQVRTFTHGADMDTYKTEGVLIEVKEVTIPIELIASDEEIKACTSQSKFKAVDIDTIFGPMKMCAMSVMEVATTAMIVPGSSGGAVVNSNGDLIGVVSAGGDGFGFLVRLSDVHAFLAGY